MKLLIAVLAVNVALTATAFAQSPAKSREQTMHDTYCIACHGTEVYTRDTRIANDYASLREQVKRWQAVVNLKWSDEDIDAMSRWLAGRYYGMSCPANC